MASPVTHFKGSIMPSRNSDAAAGECHTLTDGEGVELESNEPFRFACCDCGLVHDMVIVAQDGKPVGFAVKRAPEATEERRATLGASFDHWLYHEQTEHDVDSLNKSAIELARAAFQRGRATDNKEQ